MEDQKADRQCWKNAGKTNVCHLCQSAAASEVFRVLRSLGTEDVISMKQAYPIILHPSGKAGYYVEIPDTELPACSETRTPGARFFICQKSDQRDVGNTGE